MTARPLHAIIAENGQLKKAAHTAQTELYKQAQKSSLYVGLSKKYAVLREGDSFAPSNETKRVQLIAGEVLKSYRQTMAPEWDSELSLRAGNQEAAADVVVDGNVLVNRAPTAFLLYMEKELESLKTFLSKMPVRDPATAWEDTQGQAGIANSPTAVSSQGRKVQEPIVLAPATIEHPAQAQLITKDVIIGQWESKTFTGAMTPDRKRELLSRVTTLAIAVKTARLEANSTVVENRAAAANLFSFLLS